MERMQREMENLQADHLRDSQELVRQFNEAQELLKDKISELQIAYVRFFTNIKVTALYTRYLNFRSNIGSSTAFIQKKLFKD